MGNDWIDDFLKNQSTRRADSTREAELERMSAGQAPQMFRKLCARIDGDLSRYRTGGGVGDITSNLEPSQMSVQNGSYPHFALSIVLEENSITATIAKRKHADSSGKPVQKRIFIKSKGIGALYYRIEGDDELHIDEGEVSKKLLGPLLEFISS